MNNIKEHCSKNLLASFTIGSIINTECGKGVIVKMDTPFNGLFYEPHLTEVVVWYGTNNVFNSPDVSNPWVAKTFNIVDLLNFNNMQLDLNHKIPNY